MNFRKDLPKKMSYVLDEGSSRLTFWVAADGELLVNIYKQIDDVSYTSVTHPMGVASALALRDYLNGILPVEYALREE